MYCAFRAVLYISSQYGRYRGSDVCQMFLKLMTMWGWVALPSILFIPTDKVVFVLIKSFFIWDFFSCLWCLFMHGFPCALIPRHTFVGLFAIVLFAVWRILPAQFISNGGGGGSKSLHVLYQYEQTPNFWIQRHFAKFFKLLKLLCYWIVALLFWLLAISATARKKRKGVRTTAYYSMN